MSRNKKGVYVYENVTKIRTQVYFDRTARRNCYYCYFGGDSAAGFEQCQRAGQIIQLHQQFEADGQLHHDVSE